MSTPVIIIAFLLVVAVSAYVAHQANKKRVAALTAYATSRGWTLAPGRDRTGIKDALHGTPFRSGDSRHVSNVITGVLDGRRCQVFDFTYVTRSRSSNGHTTTTSHPFRVVTLGVGATLPRLEVTPETFMSRAIGKLMDSDINFEDEEFNRAFTVSCDDRKLAYDVIHPRMMEMLKTSMREARWKIDGDRVIAFDDGRTVPEQIDADLAGLEAIVNLIPQFVIEERAGR